MKELPRYQLSPKIKNVWRISDFVSLTITFLICFIPLLIGWTMTNNTVVAIIAIIIAGLYVVGLIVLLVIMPPIRFMRWRYELSGDYLDIAHGIIWKKRTIIPFIRVQNTDTRQGPILRAFKLSSVTVSTAAGEHAIPGLDNETASQVRDKAAELARLAQEDV